MAEWSIAAVLKTVELRGSGGSNPSLSARVEATELICRFFLFVGVICQASLPLPPQTKLLAVARPTRSTWGQFSPLGLSRSHNPHQTTFDGGAPSIMASPFESLSFRKSWSDRVDLSLFLFVGVICRFFVPCSLFYSGIYFHFKAKIPIFVVTTQTIIQN